jgi:hypothetical protein
MMRKLYRFLGAALAVLCLAEIADLVWLASSRATINNSINKITIAGNGAQTSFGFSFIGVTASDISVTFTSAAGIATVLAQGSGPTQYQLTLNPASPGQLWGVGGTVVYNPSGTPIPSGSTLTILRTVPLQQTVSLNNQGAFFPSAVEMGLDLLDMQIQQLAELYGRAIVAPPSDPPTVNLTLPPAAQRANTGLAFDGSGNVIAGVTPSSGTISSAMQPVVNAASLAAGRTAFGLGTMAQENINGGTCGGATIRDDGSGNARVVFQTVPDASNQAVTCAFHGQVHTATGALIYTLPRANTLFNGFGFWVYALNNSVTFAVNAADGFSGGASGASMVIPPGSQAYVSTDAAGSGTWFLNIQNNTGLNVPFNLSIACSTASNALTCALKDRNGNDPSSASPVLLAIQFGTSTAQVAPIAITAPLSITAPAGATLGTVNNQTNRLWIGLFNNAGTLALGFYNSLNTTGPNIKSWDETTGAVGTAISAGSISPQTWYTQGAITAAFRIIGYVESKQSTAGQWAATPATKLFGPGVKRPGESVQKVTSVVNIASNVTSTTFVVFAFHSAAITPQSAANLIGVRVSGAMLATGSGGDFELSLSRGITNNTGLFGGRTGLSAANVGNASAAVLEGYDMPNTTGSVAYAVQGRSPGGITLTFSKINNIASEPAQYTLEEIQI